MYNAHLNTIPSAVIFKIETTGLDFVKDKICKFSASKYENGNLIDNLSLVINPGIDISEEASKINGLTKNDFIEKPMFKDVSEEIFEFIKNSDLIGFNIKSFGLKFLFKEFQLSGIYFNYLKINIIDLYDVFKETIENSYFEIAHHFLSGEIPTNDLNSVKDFYSYLSQRNMKIPERKYLDVSGNISIENGEFILKYGSENKFRNKKVYDMFALDVSYYTWMMKSDFVPIDTKLALASLYKLYKQKN